ncbi:MAG: DEAD/DEAH box helicase [Pseudohongiellaceae bacterium]
MIESTGELDAFHPASRAWFEQRFGAPTGPQAEAWPAIRDGRHTLIAAPTGSGKTLAAFFCAIDQLVQESREGPLEARTRVLYISPLKALGNDIQRNLQDPLNGIADELLQQGSAPCDITVAVRTGDTPQPDRQKMLRSPPHILVTTPESLYLLLTSANGRKLLRTIRSVIVDEIHALLGDKRGSHLSLSLQRLEALVDGPLQRIGLSATQKPIELVARYLTGRDPTGRSLVGEDERDCVIVDAGHRRQLDLRIEVPSSPLTALMSAEVWEELYERLVTLIEAHETTLVFVNTRRLSERLALALNERLGEEAVSSHHGSMSKDHRHAAEQNLKQGRLKVLVATASMELGIDIGSVDLVVQFASPKRIATFLQRVGRSGHAVGALPKGILFPLTRDDLIECAALLDSIHRGELDRILMPDHPLDILSQQLVAEVAARHDETGEPLPLDALYELLNGAWPYRELPRRRFDALVRMLAEGYSSRLGRRGAWLHHDRINDRVSPRRGARLTALMNGGAIPDMFDYQVVLDPEDTVVGTLNEDFALETLPGDVFTLGSHSWQLLRVDGLKVRVKDAQGMKPTVPFWFGEGPGRSAELSESVSRLRETVDQYLLDKAPSQAVRWLVDELSLPEAAAQQLVDYLNAGRTALQVMPTRDSLVMERFFDEVGDMHVVIHSPFGSRLNRAWGLALRKRFCRTFNFELQAAANEDSTVISLGSVHSFVLDDVWRYLNSASARDVLIQAMLDAPMFEVRWRWNATRSLAIQRMRSRGRVPPQFQRMDAEDLIAQVFPDQLACLENIPGKRDIPEHPLVEQTVEDCLTEAMDIDGLLELLQRIENDEVRLVALDLREPSPFAQEIINARPYAFLDDAPFEERRTNAIRNRSWLDPAEQGDYSQLDPAAIERVREEAWPLMRNVEELHDGLLTLGLMSEEEVAHSAADAALQQLTGEGRTLQMKPDENGRLRYLCTERLPCIRALFPDAVMEPEPGLPPALAAETWTPEEAASALVRGRLDGSGPVSAGQLAEALLLPSETIERALLQLESEGFVFRGRFGGEAAGELWCERRLLQRIHRYTIDAHREMIRPVSLQAYALFLFALHEIREQHLSPRPVSLPSAPEGQALLQRALERLDGLSAPAAAWEGDILPARLALYDPNWLDLYCISGRVVWGRYEAPAALGAVRAGRRHSAGPVKATPVTLARRENSGLWQQLCDADRRNQDSGANEAGDCGTAAQRIREDLRQHGASFFSDLARRTGLLPAQLEEGVAELVARGQLSSDSFAGLRALLTPAARKSGGRRRRRPAWQIEDAGRWSLLPRALPGAPVGDSAAPDEQLEELVMVYLRRWGVLFRQVLSRESAPPPWRVLLQVLRRLELRGDVRGGRFIAGVGGEQFALPGTVEALRQAARPLREQDTGEAGPRWSDGIYHCLSATDPVTLLPVFLPGTRVPRVTRNRVLFCDGVAVAVLEGATVRFLREVPAEHQWALQQLLQRRDVAPPVRGYLGNA